MKYEQEIYKLLSEVFMDMVMSIGKDGREFLEKQKRDEVDVGKALVTLAMANIAKSFEKKAKELMDKSKAIEI